MSKDKRQAFARAEVGQPVPGEETFDTDDHVLAVGGDGLEKWFWPGGHIAVHENLAIPVQDAEGHRASVQVDATIKLVLLGVKSPEVSSSSLVFSLLPAYHWGMWRGGLNKYQGCAADCLQPPLRCGFRQQLTPGVRHPARTLNRRSS